MTLNQPTKLFFTISLLLAILATVALFTSVAIPMISGYATYVLLGAYIVLALSCIVKGM